MDGIESEIEVIVFFYEKGKSKADYIRKETAHVVVPKDLNTINLVRLKKIFW